MIVLGICAMDKKLETERLNEVILRLDLEPIKVVIITQDIMHKIPVS